MVKVVNDDCSTEITSDNRGRNSCMLVTIVGGLMVSRWFSIR